MKNQMINWVSRLPCMVLSPIRIVLFGHFITSMYLSCTCLVIVLTEMKAICRFTGNSDVETFDGRNFRVSGSCAYQMAGDCIDNTFSVHVRNDQNCSIDRSLPCNRSLNLYFGSANIKLHVENEMSVSAGGNKLTLPTTYNGVVIQHVGTYVLFYGWSDVTIKWDGHSGIYIEFPNKMINKTCGLCGNYDGLPSNDFVMNGGGLTSSAAKFINSWKMEDVSEHCRNVYDSDIFSYYDQLPPGTKQSIDLICSGLNSQVFSSCNAVVSTNPYIEQCKEDVARCTNATMDSCSCDSFTQYSRACASRNIVLNWRRADFCCEFAIPLILNEP